MATSPNPYQSPVNIDSGSPVGRTSLQTFKLVPRRWYDKLTLFEVSIASGLYFTFIALLLDYGSLDRVVGTIFLINVPVLLIWIVQLLIHRRVSYGYGFSAASTQFAIMLAMISIGLSNQNIVATNLAIALGFGMLGLQCQLVLRLAKHSTAK